MQNRCVDGGSYPVCKLQQRVKWRRHHDVNHAMTSRKYIFPHRLFRYQHFLSRFSRWWIHVLLIWLLFLVSSFRRNQNKVRSIYWNQNFQNRSRNKETEKNHRLDAILDWLYFHDQMVLYGPWQNKTVIRVVIDLTQKYVGLIKPIEDSAQAPRPLWALSTLHISVWGQ